MRVVTEVVHVHKREDLDRCSVWRKFVVDISSKLVILSCFSIFSIPFCRDCHRRRMLRIMNLGYILV